MPGNFQFKLSHLPLRPSTLSILTRRGFNSTGDVQSSRASLSNFAAELEISLVEAANIGREVDKATQSILQQEELKLSHPSSSLEESESESAVQVVTGGEHVRLDPGRITAASLLNNHLTNQKTLSSRPIITFSRSVDTLLGGGFQPCEVTEIVGMPGVGKTQLAMQVCVDAALPKEFGGVAGSSCYIDSEGSFSPERCWDMADALVNHVKNSARNSAQRQRRQSSSSSSSSRVKVVPKNFSSDSILDSIHVFRCHDEASQTATIRALPGFLDKKEESGNPVKVLVVDSIAFHYRCSSSDYKSRTKSLSSIAANLADIANKYNLAVVVINQMTTSFNPVNDISQNSSNLVPALGESWAHNVTTRVMLSMDLSRENSIGVEAHQRRICRLCKSPSRPSGEALFSLTQFGIRDCLPAS